jgi:flavin-dependent dehydrogenase
VEVTSYDVAIVGAGPAGCAAAITAARAAQKTILFERGHYPRHKVCGEFVSPESHHLLEQLLGTNSPLLSNPPRITHARMFADGNCVQFDLDAPAWSITRYDLDFALWQAAQQNQAECRNAPVDRVARVGDHFELTLPDKTTITAKKVINASGRWSNLRRPIVESGPRWIGIKAHFSGEQAPLSTDIYFFPGGYCGVQPISPAQLNASAMVRADVATTLDEVFAAHPDLWLRSRDWERATDIVTTSPLVHVTPQPVTNGVLNAGDAAAFIDPFVGDGISLALRSGVLAAQCMNAEAYAAEYTKRFARAFHTAALVRRLVYAPELIRRLAVFSFRSKSLRKWALNRTRAI